MIIPSSRIITRVEFHKWRWGLLEPCSVSSCIQDRTLAPRVNASLERPGSGPEPAGVV